MHTFNEWVRLEQTGRKAIRAAKEFARDDDWKNLDALETILAELRHAAGQLGESPDRLGHENTRSAHAVMIDDDEQALQRLREALFKRLDSHSPQPPDIHGSVRRSDNNPERRAEDGYVGA